MRVGPYEILEEAGRGGRGVVLRARAPDGSVVAVKILQATSDPDALARFDRERRLLAAFGRGDGFVPLLDAGTAQGCPYLVMPFLEGGTLRKVLERGPLPPEQAAPLFVAIAKAMAIAHERGIVHRDLKPENILFAPDGAPLVADLGLGKHFKRSTPGASQTIMLSIAGQFRGTIGYMAPEQAQDAMTAGPPADVFALGAILHEAVTGEPAFSGESPVEVISKIEDGRYDRSRRTEPWIEAIVAKALDPRPERRYPDAGSLGRAIAAGPAGYRPPSKLPLVVGALVVVAGVVGLVALLGTRTAARVLEDPAPHLAAARAANDPRTRVAEAKRVIELARGDAPEARAARGEAYEMVARARLEANDAAGSFAAATEALALAPDLEPRQLLLAHAALRAGRPDEAFAAVAKHLDDPAPALEVFRAAAAAHLAHERFADAEAVARRGLATQRDDPELLLARGRALRALGRSPEALSPLSTAARSGDLDARAELALATIEAVKLDEARDPKALISNLDRPESQLEAEVDNLIAAVEKEWPHAKMHPQARAVVGFAFERICGSIVKARSVAPKELERWAPTLARVKRLHATITQGKPRELGEATAALGILCCYANDPSLAEQCFERSATLPPRLRFALRATLGVSYFMSPHAAATAACHFDEAAARGLKTLDAALAEDPAEIEKIEREDLFVRELHRTALRAHCWALWRLALTNPRPGALAERAPSFERAVKSGRAAIKIPRAFDVFADAPIIIALAPALLAQDQLDEAEELVSELEAFNATWEEFRQSSNEMSRHGLTMKWDQVHELRGDLELRRRHFARAVTAFETATRTLDSRSSWFGLAKAKRELGDEAGARLAEHIAVAAGHKESYLVWLER